MIINETFMWLYTAYKIGNMCTIFAIMALLVSLFTIPVLAESVFTAKVIWGIAGLVLIITIPVSALSPSFEEVKAYAVYAISKDVADSDSAKRIIEATLNKLENK